MLKEYAEMLMHHAREPEAASIAKLCNQTLQQIHSGPALAKLQRDYDLLCKGEILKVAELRRNELQQPGAFADAAAFGSIGLGACLLIIAFWGSR